MTGRPVLAVSLAFSGGVALGAWLPQEPVAWGWAAAATLSAWVALCAAGRLAAGSRIGLALFVIVGIFRIQGDLAPLFTGRDPLAEGDAVAGGRISRPGEIRDGEMVLHLDQVRLRRNGETVRLDLPLQIIVPVGGERYSVGDLVTVRGKVRSIRGDRNLGWFPGPRPGSCPSRRIQAAVPVPSFYAGAPPRMPSGRSVPGQPARFSTH